MKLLKLLILIIFMLVFFMKGDGSIVLEKTDHHNSLISSDQIFEINRNHSE